jgi:hypothetical protein
MVVTTKSSNQAHPKGTVTTLTLTGLNLPPKCYLSQYHSTPLCQIIFQSFSELQLTILIKRSRIGCRYVAWTAYLLRYHGKSGDVEPVALPGAPFSHYYAQEASDEGIIMETDVGVKEVSISSN